MKGSSSSQHNMKAIVLPQTTKNNFRKVFRFKSNDTQQLSPQSNRLSEPSLAKLKNTSFDKGDQFPPIFTKNKRNAYSGYKKYNINKSKLINLKEPDKSAPVHVPARKYELNFKNVARLRKRYSLDPHHVAFHLEESLVVKNPITHPEDEGETQL